MAATLLSRPAGVNGAWDPDADRPSLTMTRSGRLPLLPSFGLRYRF